MSSNEKYAFSARMNQVAELLKIPERGRQTLLGKMFEVSQESARKWLQGEGFPSTEKSIEIAKKAGVSYEWFMTGRGLMPDEENLPADTPEGQVLRAMEHMDGETKYRLTQITQALVAPAPQAAPLAAESKPKPEEDKKTPKTGDEKPESTRRQHFGIGVAKPRQQHEQAADKESETGEKE